jgi:hypothetical protein
MTMRTYRFPFMAALPHELDGTGPTRDDLPLYVKRVDDLMHQCRLAVDDRNEYAKRLQYAVELLAAARPDVGYGSAVSLMYEIDNFVDMMREDGWV